MARREAPVATAEMLIRKPADEVYEAFVDPAVTTKFWFTGGSARLEVGRPVTWAWEMYGVSTRIEVKELVPAGRYSLERKRSARSNGHFPRAAATLLSRCAIST